MRLDFSDRKSVNMNRSPFPLLTPLSFCYSVFCMAEPLPIVNARYYLCVHLFDSASSIRNDRWNASDQMKGRNPSVMHVQDLLCIGRETAREEPTS